MSEHNLSATVGGVQALSEDARAGAGSDPVRDPSASKDKSDLTDQTLLLVQSTTRATSCHGPHRISTKLIEVLRMDEEAAVQRGQGGGESNYRQQYEAGGDDLIRAMVNNVLIERGYKNRTEDLSLYQIPREFIEH